MHKFGKRKVEKEQDQQRKKARIEDDHHHCEDDRKEDNKDYKKKNFESAETKIRSKNDQRTGICSLQKFQSNTKSTPSQEKISISNLFFEQTTASTICKIKCETKANPNLRTAKLVRKCDAKYNLSHSSTKTAIAASIVRTENRKFKKSKSIFSKESKLIPPNYNYKKISQYFAVTKLEEKPNLEESLQAETSISGDDLKN